MSTGNLPLAKRRLRNLFVATVFVGVVGITLGRVLTVGGLTEGLLTIGVPLLAMGCYMVGGYIADPANVATELFADSIYYQGFLFTLVALGVSLTGFDSGDDAALSGLVARFAVALATTIVGLTARVVLVSFYSTTDDSLHEAEQSLATATDRLREGIDGLSAGVAAHLAAFETAMSQAVKSTHAALEETIKSTGGALDTAVSGLTGSVTRGADVLEGAFAKADSGLRGGSAGAVEALKERLAASTAEIESAAGRLARGLVATELPRDLFVKELQTPLDQLRAHLDAYGGQVEESLEPYKGLQENARRLQEAVDSMAGDAEKLATALADVGTRFQGMDRITDEATALADSLTHLKASSDAHLEAFRKHATAIRDMSNDLSTDVGVARSHKEQLEKYLSDATEAVGSVNAQLVDAAQFIVDELGAGR